MSLRKAKRAIKTRVKRNGYKGFTPEAEKKAVDARSKNINLAKNAVFYFS